MFLTRILLKNFRNYKSLDFSPGRSINVLIGKNAQGKTNLLEAMYILSSLKSFRVKKEEELLEWESSCAEINAWIKNEDYEKKIDIRWAKQGMNLERRVFKNDAVIKKAGDFLGEVPITLFVPGDLDLVQGGPVIRRRLLDVLLCKISHQYYTFLSNYQKILHQRNKFLHICAKKSGIDPLSSQDQIMMDVWNSQLASWGSGIVIYRFVILKYLEKFICSFYSWLSDESGSRLKLSYQSKISRQSLQEVFKDKHFGCERDFSELSCREKAYLILDDLKSSLACTDKVKELFLEAVRKNYKNEIINKSTQTGPHRDDFCIDVKEGRDLKTFGSQGQHRSAALSLRLAEAEIMSIIAQEESIILLDDCFSELDKDRSADLISYLSSLGQVFLTTANPLDFFSGRHDTVKFFNVSSGSVSECSGF